MMIVPETLDLLFNHRFYLMICLVRLGYGPNNCSLNSFYVTFEMQILAVRQPFNLTITHPHTPR